MRNGYFINIYGRFRIFDHSGCEVVLRNQKEKALFVLLCLSPGYSRSRNWLKAHLWSDRQEQQASSSLRQAIWRIKASFPDGSSLLEADRDGVWLRQSMLRGVNTGDRPSLELFEGADINDEAFEEWLLLARQMDSPKIESQSFCRLPCVIISNPVINGLVEAIDRECDSIVDDVVSLLHTAGLVDVFDARNLHDDQSGKLAVSSESLDTVVFWSFQQRSSLLDISIRIVEFGTNRILTFIKRSYNLNDLTSGSETRFEILAGFVDAIEAAAFETHPQYQQPSNFFKAVHQLMSHSLEGQTTARQYLERLRDERNHAVATAWCAFSYAVGIGERYETGDPAFFERARHLCEHAVATAPANALVRAIIGHVYGFVFRDFNESSENHKLARELSPGTPLVWDFSSMNALYTGHSEEAYMFAKEAVRLGRFSSLRPYYDTSVMMCASVTQRHDEAIEIGQRVLKKIPKILPVMRHMTGSLAALGRHEASLQMLNSIQKHDAEFSLDALRDPAYPIIAEDSVELLTRAFAQLGQR